MTLEQNIALDEVVWADAERMSGTPCFRGTRVPIQALIDPWEGGSKIIPSPTGLGQNESTAPSIFIAVLDLGLKSAVKHIVMDHVARVPTEN